MVAECRSNVFIRCTGFEGAKDALMLGRRFVRIGQSDPDGLPESVGVRAQRLGQLHDERIVGVPHDHEVKAPVGVEVASITGDPPATLQGSRPTARRYRQ